MAQLQNGGSGNRDESLACYLPSVRCENRETNEKRRMSSRMNIDSQITQQLSGRKEDALSIPLQAAWALVLHYYTRLEDVCFGYQECDFAGDVADIPEPVVARFNIARNMSLNEIMEQVKGKTGKYAKKAHLENVASFQILYNTAVVLRVQCPQRTVSKGNQVGLALPNEDKVRVLAKIDNGSLNIFLEWWHPDISASFAANLSEVYNRMLSNLLGNYTTSVNDLGAVTERDINQILRWNSVVPKAVEKCIHEIIEEKAYLRSDAEAVCAWDGSLTYAELDCLASHLTSHLLDLGVGPETRVCLCFDKSKWNIVAMLAVLKAGGAFVPLDPSHPIPRLETLVQAVGAKCLLVSTNHANRLAVVIPNVVPVDDDLLDCLVAEGKQCASPSRPESKNAAYILFTSGSTGEPKGTVTEHQAFCSGAYAHALPMLIGPDSRMLQFSAHTFDASLVEILTTLICGGCVCIPSEEARLNGIAAAIKDMRVNHAVLTPSFVRFLAPTDVPGLKKLVLAGEALTQTDVETWCCIALCNGYGPTESSVAAIVNTRISKHTDCHDIGFPVGVRCWVVHPEDHDILAPVGCCGELLLEGPALARGYINNPEKTKESFIFDPKWVASDNTGISNRRFYKTGDLVRYNSDSGSFDFVGRKDTQVKFHGQRIELGEIETHLVADFHTKHSLISLPKSGPLAGKLVAVVTLIDDIRDCSKKHGTPLKLLDQANHITYITQMRERLSSIIPAYMVPSTWLCIEAFPVLASQKLDRKRVTEWLGAPQNDTILQCIPNADANSQDIENDLTEIQRELRDIWSHVLNIPLHRTSLKHSFLSLGGDSITAMTCMNLCKSKGLGLRVQEILRSKSIIDLAFYVKMISRETDYHEDLEKPFDLSPIQDLHFRVRNDSQGHFNQSFFLRLKQEVNPSDIQRALETIISRHSMLRARYNYNTSKAKWEQRITRETTQSYRFKFHDKGPRDHAQTAISNSQASLNATTGPMVAVDLFHIGEDGQFLSLIGHHLVIDLVSWRVILEDLEEILLKPQSPSLLEATLPFQNWCHLQADHAANIALETSYVAEDVPAGDMAYWGMLDRPNTYGDVVCVGFEFDKSSTSSLLTKCNQALRTEPVDIMVAALLHSFHEIFPDHSLPVVHNEGHGREVWDQNIDVSRTIGWFTAIYPILVRRAAFGDFVETLVHVKDRRRRVSDNGRAYFARSILTNPNETSYRNMEISFNFLGRYQQLEKLGALFQPVEGLAGEATRGGGAADYGENTPRFGLFEISAVVAEDTLRFRFAFNGGMQKQDRIRLWISSCQSLLNRVSKDLLAIQVRTTIGDFPLMTLDYDDLSRLTTEILPEMGIRSLNDVEDIYPCSSMQEGLLISKTRDTSFYAVHSTYEITRTGGPVDAHRLADSWQQIVDRHAMLRTVIVENLSPNHLYSQVVLLRYDCKPLFVSCADESEVMSTLDANTRKMNSRKPEHQFTICATRTGRVFCRLEMSHTTMDGTSTSLILRDLERAYGGSLNQSAKPLFSKFVSFLQSQPKQASINFWQSYLVNVEPCHISILNDGLVAERQYRTLRLKFNDFARLQSTCEQHGFTVPNALHGAWSLTLRCCTGSEEVCFGYLLSERDVPVDGVEDAIGPMINMLACRVNMPSEITVGHLLEQIQRDYMRSLPFKHTSLADVQHAIGLSGTALFNTCFSYRKLPPLEYSHERNIEFSECTELHDPTEYFVTINVEASDTNAVIDLDYWTDTLSDGQAANIAEIFVKSLENVIDHLTESLKDLEFLGDRHLEQIAKWNSVIPGSIHQCVHEVFEEQAKIRPDSPAVSSWDGNFTYSQINELSTRLCYYLLKNGLSSEIAVALCFDKSAYTIIAMLAILKAGGTCVPLDAGHPKAALDLRILEANTQFVLSSPSRVYLLEDIVPCVITVDEALFDEIPAFEEMAIENARPENAAFIMFTSGSTGKPKGVVLEHRSLVTSAAAHGEALGVGPASRFLQFASYSFDNSLEEIFTTLMRGGCVCIPSEDDRMNNLAKAMEELSVNIADLTSTVVAFLQPSDVPSLKTLAIGGEAPTKDTRDSWGKALELQNIYGPTECSINCCHNPNIGLTGDVTNIGRSIGSLSWVANPNDHNHLLPIGCTGELLIEGPILARGYLNNPDKTQQNFIENPKFISQFRNHDMDSEAIGSTTRRIYKTGDLVRYNSDGSLVYIGRKDTQVKLNGQRIELGEIEHRVHESLPSDGQCAVDLIGSKKGKSAKFLVVFVCLKESDKVAPRVESELIKPMSKSFEKMAKNVKSSLVSFIQMYMVPNVYIPISSMPITSSGKLDRRLLRTSCERLSAEEISTYRLGGRSGRPASTEPEKLLHRLWASILDIDGSTIGADDTFFRHGGDSISAIRLVTSVRLEGYSLGVADIFQRPKLSDMAQSISGQSSTVIPQPTAVVEPFTLLGPSVSFPELKNEIVSICQIPTEAIEDVYPCSALQEGLVAISGKQPGSYVTQNVYSLAHRVDIRKFKAAWEMVAVSETILRTRIIHSRTHGFLQVVVREPLAWTSVENIEQLPETHNHLPKSHGGILSCYTIIGEDSETPGFIWTAHHAVYDGWSLPLLLAKVKSQYYGLAKIDRNPRCSYPQFIKYMRAVDRDQSSVFWKDKLDDSTTTRFPVSPVMLYKTSPRSQMSDTVTLPDTSEIEATVPSIIRAAWALTISVYTFSDDVIFGEILTGRDVPLSGISDMIGPTLATVPMRLRLNRDLPIVEYLHDVQTQAASVIPYQFFGLQNIKKLTDDARSACDFQNIFTVAYYDSDDAEGLFNLVSANSGNSGFFTYPLNVSCIISGNQIRLQVDYDQRVLPTAQLKRLLTQFETILANLCFSSNAEMRLGDLDLMGHADLALIRHWNMNPLSTVNQCVHEAIDENARLRPEAMAICSWDGKLTYRELSEYSTSLAHQLRKLVNIETGSFVPICFEKSLFTPITMLAIMKAGCAFVPLDSQHPTARLRQITGNLGTNFILCSPCHVMFCEQLAQKAVAVDWDLVRNRQKTQSSLEKVPSHSPAYAIFTSGSTGQPKGCIIEHASICTGAIEQGAAFSLGPTSRVLQFASYSFDASLLEMMTTMMMGGCVCVPDDKTRLNDVANFINDMNVNTAFLTPSMARMIQPSDVPSLRNLALVGEAMSPTHVSIWSDKVNLMNAYGPTETSIVAAVKAHMSSDTDPANLGSSIGTSWIVDPNNHDRLVPVGAIGELLIEGPTLARGYLHNKEKTELAFIKAPKWASEIFSGTPSVERRMYKTGDLVSYVSDESGELLYIGRKDHQAKRHGQRLELEEIEHHLNADRDILNSVVAMPKTGKCAGKLVATLCLLGSSTKAQDEKELRLDTSSRSIARVREVQERLAERLPAYMIPSNWVILEQLPLSSSGKLKRRQITHYIDSIDGDIYRQTVQADEVDNRNQTVIITETETRLRSVWGAVLNMNTDLISLERSFLHLGGDSMSAMAVMARCRSENLGVTVENIITCKSIRHLATLATKPQLPEREDNEDNHEFDLSPIQNLYFRCMEGNSTRFNQSILLRLRMSVSDDFVRGCISGIMKIHSMLRARFHRDANGIWKQHISSDAEGSYTFRARTVYQPSDISGEIENIQNVVNIVDGPLVGVALFKHGSGSAELFICAHHLVVDVVSWDIILQDLENLFQQKVASGGEGTSFRKWCRLQSDKAKRDKSVKVLPLEDVPVADFAYWGMDGKSNLHGDAITEDIQFDLVTTNQLLQICRGTLRVDFVDLLLASLLVSFCRVFPDRDRPPAIYNEGHGRESGVSSIELSRTVGWFTTFCPIHIPHDTGPHDDCDLLQCISWVKQLRNRIPDKGAAYFAQRLLTWEGNEKYGKHWPMEIAFNYLGKHNASEASDTMLELINGTGQSVNSCSDIEPLVPRFALIDISAAVVQGHLNLSFSYNKLMARQTEIQKWASVCRDLLGETLVNLPSETCQVGSSDFRLLPLSYNSLNKLKGGLLNVGISSFDGVEDVYPCSQMQEGILLSQLKDPHTYAYQAIFEVQTRLGESSVNLERLDAAWQEVVQRHAALRTIFVDGSHESSFIDQVVLKLTDARALVLGCDDADARSFLSNIEIIDFRNGRPPVRLALCKTRSGRVFARFDTTNAVCDGSSIPIILRDISRSYFRLPPVTLERPLYSDFISHLQSIPKERGIKYWKEYLAGTEPCVLPSMTTGRESAKRLGSHIFVLDSFSEAQNFCKNVGVTTSALLQLVWGLVLRCYTGSDDICFGYISSGRDASVKGIRDAVGAFINMLIYKIDLSNDLSVGDTMKRTQLDFVRSMEHQSVSLAEVQHELGLSEVALFNTVFTFQRRNEIEQDSISALSFTSFETSDASEYKLAINVEMTESITEVHMSYWVNYLSEQQVQNIADTFQQTVQDIIQQNNTELRIGDIDFFGSHSCNKVREWNCSLKERENRCVHELIDERVHLQSPEATAIQGWDASFTYEELSSATNRLAISLIQRGVGPEVYVPLCFEKSAWAIVAQLAVLKAGGAFVSLDPSHPEDRLRGLLDDVRGTLVLSSALQSDKVSRICDQVIILDQKTIQELQNQLTSLSSPASPSNSAYVIFTSGSTGKPKGTIIEHAQLCTSALAQGKALHMTSESRVIQFASYTFDASIMEIFTTLIAGGCVCVPSDEDRMNDIAGAVSRHRANWMFSTPSVANTLKPDSIPSVKVFLMGGEKLTQGIIERWAKSACVVEAYGPSECAVVCASDEKADMNGQIVNSDPSTIGRAVGSRSWIVDQRDFNHLVPVGAVGELVIEGHIVGRGYLNDERKTNESFIQDPQWATSVGFRGLIRPGSRMYRTGDLVRYNTDGSISYVARKDMQIKLNGQRVELGEIEYQCSLRMPEHVQLAVDLIAPALQAGAKKLAMFFAIEQDGEAGQRIDRTNDQLELLQMSPSIRNMTRKLGKSLAKILPSYMIPQLFFPVSLLPITTSGKLDRRKLHAEVQVLSIETLKSYSLLASMQGHSPENQMQEMLQGLWGEVLGIPRSSINIEDSFFRIGGDSLAVMKLTGRARSRGISLSAVDIFRYPILKDLAEKCGKSKNTKFTTLKPFDLVNKSEPLDEVINEVASHCGVDRAIISDIYPCSPLQEGLITSSVRQSGAYVNQNVFRLSDEIEISKFKASWQQLVDEFDLLRTRIVHTASSNFLQVVLKQQVISWHNAECLEELTGDYMALPETDGGLLTKYTLVQDRGSSSLYFVWSIHHALYDAWGLSIILQRVKELYFSTASSMKSAPYANFIDYLQKRDTSASDTFWKTHLSNLSPNSFPNTSNTSDKRVSKIISAAVEISDAISSMDLTIPNLIRAAWAVVLSSRTQSMDVYFGETLTGRNIDVPGITDMAGPVLTTVPTRLQVNPEMEIKEYLMEVQRISTEIIPHQHSGLQHIKRLSRDAALACDFQNLIVVQTAEDTLGNSLWEVQDDHTIVSFFTYPLVVECKVSNGSIPVNIHYDEKAITTWEAEKLLQQFSYLLQQLSSFNDFDGEKLGNLDMVSPEDRKEISQWNRRNPELVDECIHGLFRQKCDSNPHAAGVHAWDGDLTYRELDEYASAVAGYLRSLGVKPEVFVPICLEKSAWTIVIMFGVLMAGGAIVPLDPSHPLSRHQEILEELGTNFIIFSPQYSARYTDIVQHAIAMDGQVISNLPQTSRSHRHIDDAVGSNAAYAIFTSGSTGKAKGITVDHRAFASSSKSFGSAMRMDSGSRVLQFASLSFDAALLEIFTTLTVGGCICIPNEEDRLKDLSGTICRMTVSWTLLTPSVANLIDPSSVPHLKVLVCGGEAMSPEIIARWSDQVHLINAYGPSEASVVATINPSVSNESPSCIGYGTQSTLTWVVNAEDYNELSPLGTVGELALEGPTLARGYLNDSIKTRASFVDNPAWVAGFPSALSGTRRIHLTGDLVKYRHDGSLEYVGRKDSQVKLHGQRMDLGEIEQRLDAVPRVRHVIVIMPKTGHFQKRLIAIISLHSSSINNSVLSVESCELVTKGQQVDSELAEIKDCLSKQLPSYMLPQAWAIVSRLPMLVSGKLDRKKVKNWVESLSEETYQMIAGIHGEDEHAVEATGVTATLQDIWAQVLNLPREKVKLNRSFLSLGGDSITAMAVVSRSRRYNMTISLKDMLRCESIVQLASTVEAGIVKVSYEEKINVPFNLSPIQQLYFQAAKKHEGSSRFNQSFTLRLSKYIDPQRIKLALNAIVSQHSMLRARFKMSGDGHWEQYLSSGIESTYRYQIHAVNEVCEVLPLIGKSQGSLDIVEGPVFAANLFDCQNNAQILFMGAHHLCVDIVSWRIILQDLQEVLESESLPFDKPLPFQAWCSLQSEYVKRDANAGKLPFPIIAANLGYWGMDGISNTYGDAEFKTLELDEAVTTSTITGCHDVFRTDPVDVLLSAVIHSFRRIFSDRFLPTLFNEGHGRQAWDSSNDPSRTVGWFTNISPLRVTLESDDVLQTLRLVKDARRSLPENGHRYLAHRFLNPNTRTRPSPSDVPMEILFNYLGAMQQLESDDSLFQSVELAKNRSDHLSSGDMGPDTPRLALFDISAVVMKGRLEFTFIFNRSMRRYEEMDRWISECKWTLEEIAMRLRRCKTEPTLSDYPLLPINYDGLKILLRESLPRAGITDSEQVEDVYPCSPTTEGILLGQLRDPNTYIFHAIYEVRSVYTGCEVEPQRLIEAWQKVVDRHAALRTVFVDSPYKGGAFDQCVLKSVDSGIIHIECKDPEVIPRLQSIRLRDKNARRKLHLPHQMTICSTSTGRVIIKVEINHAVIDGGSTPILLQDLSLAYEGRLTDDRGPLYSDYIRFIRSQSADADVVFWKTYLTGVQPCHLPHQKSNASKRRKLESLVMAFDQWSELQQYCEKSGVTLSNVVQASWALVLRKYTGCDDVCFGYLSAGRDSPVNGIQEAIGVFINLLCCRVQLSPSQLLAEIPGKIQDDFLDGLPHQRCSLAQVQHEVGLHGKQLFNTALSIQNHSRASDEEELSLEFEAQGGHDPSEYVVTLNIETARDDEGVVFRYWSDNFTIDQITGIVNALANAFRAFIKDATETISHLNIDSSVEKTVVEKQQWKVDQTEAFTRDYIWQLLQDHPALQSLIDERVRTIVRQMPSHAVRGDVRPNDEIPASTSRKIPNVAEDDSSKVIQSESDDFSNTSDGSYEVIETPMASQIEGRGRNTTLEQKLRCLWSDKLNLPPSSIAKNDSFFDLGGDSIAAMGLVGDARDEGLILTVADIFRNPFFENMVSVVRIASEMSFVDEEINNMNRLGNQPISMATNAGMHERFALLKSANIDEAFLQKYICRRIGVFKGGIADILPVSDFQALSITGSLLDSRWMLNFFYLDGHGPVDFRRLKQSCFRVVQAFDILRTVFVASKGRFLQVILRKVQPEFSIYETEGRLDDFTALLQQRNRERGVQQGEPFVQFIVAKEKGTDRHRILVRLSHAQYDGLCLPRILAAIKAGYEGGPIPSTASFAHYIRESARTITSGHYTHWRTLLQGSRMTQMVHRRGPTYGKTVGTTQVLTKRTRVPSLANGNITTATVIKAAWALTLARITGSPDVVFGHTISGRSIGGLTGVESMVGPCVNLVPVRVQFRDNWTVHDLLRHVQDQQVANMPFEALGFRQIIKHCTDWSRWAYFSTVIQHDSVDSSSEMQLGENDYRVKVIGSNENLEDFMINSRQVERDHVDIAISFSCGRSVTVPLAQRVLDMVCDAAASFAANTNMTLPTPAALSALPTQAIDEPAQPPQENTFTSTRLTGLSRAETLILTDVIRRAWEQVLTDKDEALLPSPVKFDSSFFELGGDLIGLAQVVWLLEQEDFRVRLNDLIEHPTMMGQMAVLAHSNLAKTRKMTTTAQRDVVSPSSVTSGDDSPAVTTSQQQRPPKPRKSSSWASAFGIARKMVTRRVETGEN